MYNGKSSKEKSLLASASSWKSTAHCCGWTRPLNTARTTGLNALIRGLRNDHRLPFLMSKFYLILTWQTKLLIHCTMQCESIVIVCYQRIVIIPPEFINHMHLLKHEKEDFDKCTVLYSHLCLRWENSWSQFGLTWTSVDRCSWKCCRKY